MAVLLLCTGCMTTASSVGPATSSLDHPDADAEADLTPAEYEPAFRQSVAVLRDSGFVVDRQDYRFGQITSRPRPSSTIFEPWQRDHTYPDQALRATFGSLRRTARISLDPWVPDDSMDTPSGQASDPDPAPDPAPGADSAPPMGYDLNVEVLIEQRQVATRRLDGRTRGTIFADLSAVPTELSRRGIQKEYWQPVGRDPHLESRLRRQILERATPTDATR